MRRVWLLNYQFVPALLATACLLMPALLGAAGVMPARAGSGSTINISKEVRQAREITRSFAYDLRLELARALKARGLVAAVGAYHVAAPEIAARQSEASGFEVRRTALKLRNPENEASDWERKSLRLFIAKRKQGADAQDLERYEVIPVRGGDRRFRYMKAIVVNNSCLSCHGADVKRDVSSEIAKYYHDDKSKGFRPGDVIGAYSLVKVIE